MVGQIGFSFFNVYAPNGGRYFFEKLSDALSNCPQDNVATSAHINWDKCASFLLGDWVETGPPQLPVEMGSRCI